MQDGREGTGGTVSGRSVREHLGLTSWQLRELTSEMRIDVGERPNYPQYRFDAFHQMATFQLLREIQVPVEDARRAVGRYADEVLAGKGWLGMAPVGEDWSAVLVRTSQDLVSWLRMAQGRGCVIDLEQALSRTWGLWFVLSR